MADNLGSLRPFAQDSNDTPPECEQRRITWGTGVLEDIRRAVSFAHGDWVMGGRKLIGPESVTHVAGTKCHPCVRAGP